MIHAILTGVKQNKFDKKLEKFIYWHPLVSFVVFFAGIPILVLTTVFVCTAVIVLPITWIMG